MTIYLHNLAQSPIKNFHMGDGSLEVFPKTGVNVAVLLGGFYLEVKMVICHPHDEKWIAEQIALLPAPMREKILGKYSHCYESKVAENAGKVASEGIARREANTRLRECVDRFGSAYHGAVSAPPKI